MSDHETIKIDFHGIPLWLHVYFTSRPDDSGRLGYPSQIDITAVYFEHAQIEPSSDLVAAIKTSLLDNQ